MNKKIILIAMPNSVHTARFVNQIAGMGWDIYIFPSIGDVPPHPDLKGAKVIRSFDLSRKCIDFINISFVSRLTDWLFRRYEFHFLKSRTKRLVKLIENLSPVLVHSLEIQGAGYLALEAKKQMGAQFPKWMVTNWGSDIFLFGRLKNHSSKIKEVLSSSDYYSCECKRDLDLAITFGFKGKFFPVLPNTGGFDLALLRSLNVEATSSRRLIMLKGYQGWAGRALVGLRALERCKDLLGGYRICIYSANPDVILAAELFTQNTGVVVDVIPKDTTHHEILRLHSQARISIGLSISDAVSTSFLEALACGSFPIQSCTACVDEWITHGEGGLIVPPEDPDVIEMALRTALTDDVLVDAASRLNWQLAEEVLGREYIRQRFLDEYKLILDLT
jgi:glycosyltransferase involved in cell wall biosynthesis